MGEAGAAGVPPPGSCPVGGREPGSGVTPEVLKPQENAALRVKRVSPACYGRGVLWETFRARAAMRAPARRARAHLGGGC